MNILSSHLRYFTDYARIRGVAADILPKLPDSTSTDLTEPESMVTQEEFYEILKEIDRQLTDELLGIKCGNFISLKLLGIIYQISLQATTVEEAFHYLRSYLEVALPIVQLKTVISEKEARIELRIDNREDRINRLIIENCLTIISRELRMMVGRDVNIGIGTPYFHSGYPADWVLDQHFSVSFELTILKAALKDRNHLHLDMLVPEYLKMIEQLQSGNSFANKVRITMLSMSDPKLPDIQSISDALYLTPRTLQRRLVQEELTYREITEGLKKQICSFLLRHDPYSISSLTYILGYAEPASFIHSFKKWYGDSPQRVRRRLKEPF
ncbi:helix-turn-helix domain-containing protein [Dyadobacter pollutisoli]|jgi:AraC-like DNA-binding protein|uniref:AraC family transcriptional regulator ligand-binding domain-containing protein n=1 Tax=Dyadobacter pollutisoli TaxID=2910158 RepID=A0A9E8NCX6_9BACT|nr:helix-turn-helix domain-containing protein [Dyadobacter pollutisoli]WAC11949.1 AraC family transcriptional regulator ligand-binding domain-containing protein [Dyadobacter pollutisoli]